MKQPILYVILITILIYSCNHLPFAANSPVTNHKTKDAKGTDMLLGHCSRACLHEAPYKEWFEKNYSDYTIDTANADKLTP